MYELLDKKKVSKEYKELVELADVESDELTHNILGKYPFQDKQAYKEYWTLKKIIFKDILRKYCHVAP